MPTASFSILRHRAAASLRQLRHFSAPFCAARHQNPSRISRKQQQQLQPNKNLLRAKQLSVKEYSSLAPILSPDDSPSLSESQAIGMVAAAQANFMRVIVQSFPSETPSTGTSESAYGAGVGVELLCVVKAVLKKIKRRVLVGDMVLVGSIDWVDRRGWIENVFQRKTEIVDPPVANVDHLLVLFSMEQPKLEPFLLTRFLVEAESTGIPLTLALNKAELADEEVRSLILQTSLSKS